jgi:hypothetical protein
MNGGAPCAGPGPCEAPCSPPCIRVNLDPCINCSNGCGSCGHSGNSR